MLLLDQTNLQNFVKLVFYSSWHFKLNKNELIVFLSAVVLMIFTKMNM